MQEKFIEINKQQDPSNAKQIGIQQQIVQSKTNSGIESSILIQHEQIPSALSEFSMDHDLVLNPDQFSIERRPKRPSPLPEELDIVHLQNHEPLNTFEKVRVNESELSLHPYDDPRQMAVERLPSPQPRKPIEIQQHLTEYKASIHNATLYTFETVEVVVDSARQKSAIVVRRKKTKTAFEKIVPRRPSEIPRDKSRDIQSVLGEAVYGGVDEMNAKLRRVRAGKLLEQLMAIRHLVYTDIIQQDENERDRLEKEFRFQLATAFQTDVRNAEQFITGVHEQVAISHKVEGKIGEYIKKYATTFHCNIDDSTDLCHKILQLCKIFDLPPKLVKDMQNYVDPIGDHCCRLYDDFRNQMASLLNVKVISPFQFMEYFLDLSIALLKKRKNEPPPALSYLDGVEESVPYIQRLKTPLEPRLVSEIKERRTTTIQQTVEKVEQMQDDEELALMQVSWVSQKELKVEKVARSKKLKDEPKSSAAMQQEAIHQILYGYGGPKVQVVDEVVEQVVQQEIEESEHQASDVSLPSNVFAEDRPPIHFIEADPNINVEFLQPKDDNPEKKITKELLKEIVYYFHNDIITNGMTGSDLLLTPEQKTHRRKITKILTLLVINKDRVYPHAVKYVKTENDDKFDNNFKIELQKIFSVDIVNCEEFLLNVQQQIFMDGFYREKLMLLARESGEKLKLELQTPTDLIKALLELCCRIVIPNSILLYFQTLGEYQEVGQFKRFDEFRDDISQVFKVQIRCPIEFVTLYVEFVVSPQSFEVPNHFENLVAQIRKDSMLFSIASPAASRVKSRARSGRISSRAVTVDVKAPAFSSQIQNVRDGYESKISRLESSSAVQSRLTVRDSNINSVLDESVPDVVKSPKLHYDAVQTKKRARMFDMLTKYKNIIYADIIMQSTNDDKFDQPFRDEISVLFRHPVTNAQDFINGVMKQLEIDVIYKEKINALYQYVGQQLGVTIVSQDDFLLSLQLVKSKVYISREVTEYLLSLGDPVPLKLCRRYDDFRADLSECFQLNIASPTDFLVKYLEVIQDPEHFIVPEQVKERTLPNSVAIAKQGVDLTEVVIGQRTDFRSIPATYGVTLKKAVERVEIETKLMQLEDDYARKARAIREAEMLVSDDEDDETPVTAKKPTAKIIEKIPDKPQSQDSIVSRDSREKFHPSKVNATGLISTVLLQPQERVVDGDTYRNQKKLVRKLLQKTELVYAQNITQRNEADVFDANLKQQLSTAFGVNVVNAQDFARGVLKQLHDDKTIHAKMLDLCAEFGMMLQVDIHTTDQLADAIYALYNKVQIDDLTIRYLLKQGKNDPSRVHRRLDIFRKQLATVFGFEIPNVFGFVRMFARYIAESDIVKAEVDQYRINKQLNEEVYVVKDKTPSIEEISEKEDIILEEEIKGDV